MACVLILVPIFLKKHCIMRAKYILVVAYVLLIVFSGCKKDPDDGEPSVNKMTDLVVNSSFDWKTTQDVDLQIHLSQMDFSIRIYRLHIVANIA